MKKHHTIVIYSSGSQYCNFAKDYLRQAGHDFDEKNVLRDKVAYAHMKKMSGQDNTPVLEIDGRVLIGYHPDLIERALLNDDSS